MGIRVKWQQTSKERIVFISYIQPVQKEQVVHLDIKNCVKRMNLFVKNGNQQGIVQILIAQTDILCITWIKRDLK